MSGMKKQLLSVIGVLVLLIVVVSVSYAAWVFIGTGSKINVINVGKIDISYRENTRVTLNGAYPETDISGITSTSPNSTLSFDVISDIRGEQTINYGIGIDVVEEGATLTEEYIKIYVLKDGELVSGFENNVGKTINEFAPYRIIDEIDDHVILTDSITGETSHNYTVKAWVSEDYNLPTNETSSGTTHSNETSSETFIFKIKVVATDEPITIQGIPTLDTSGANAPELVDGMIPVYYDGTNWRKADSSNTTSSSKWYDYNNKQWANAVTVTATNRETIEDAPLGTTISMEDINTMWVWIPRYSYTINNTAKGTNTGTASSPKYLTPGAIDIKFVDTETIETGTAKYTGATPTNYYTHPSFWWDNDNDGVRDTNEEKAGIWFAKFEMSHSTLASSEEDNTLGCTDTSCVNGSGIIIKPDVVSLRNNNISNFFLGARSMQVAHYNTYGFFNNTTYDIHMLKNDEWGAVAYLTQSIYGRCSSATSCTEVYINNSYGYYTGRSGGNVGGSTPINGTYPGQTSTETYNDYGFYTYDGYLLEYATNTKSSTRDMSKVASTTGNIYGIYDMSGGAIDYVMGNYNNYSGTSTSSNSGFNGRLDEGGFKTNGINFFGITRNNKYYNKYANPPFSGDLSTNITFCTQATCGGHALNETSRWYGDNNYFVYSSNSWFGRGGSSSSTSSAGLFTFAPGSGRAYDNRGSRCAIVK